jgi:uncharacterized protein GlcG (DUF336 family)
MRGLASLPLALAELVVDACRAEAWRMGVPVAIATVDGQGGAQSFRRMDGTLPVSSELAMSKAFTAAVLRMPTDALGRLAQPGQPLFGIETSHGGKIVLFGGGFPLCLAGTVVGAVGISGGSVEQDMQIGRAGLALLAAVECWAERLKGAIPAELCPAVPMDRLKDGLERELLGRPAEAAEVEALTAVIGGVLLALA